MRCTYLLAVAGMGCAWGLAMGHPPEEHAETVANTAGTAPAGVVQFTIVDEAGRAMPGRLTFVRADPSAPLNAMPELFPNTQADPEHLAVRKNVVYTLYGAGKVTVPVGKYTVYASRGLEWSLASREIVVELGKTVIWTAALKHEVDTAGWISGDFHLHTLTHSGHGDSNMNERIISLIGEGVEFAVATDHNHHTDYGPTVEKLHAHPHISTTTGNEVTTSIGHINVFPLDPARKRIEYRIGDGNALFKLMREEPNAAGVTPVIQLNHPRWLGMAYFESTGLDPVTGLGTKEIYSGDFDSIEVLNENEGWGYEDPGVDGAPAGDSRHSVLQDWFNLLNRGHHYAAVGNSDSHTVHFDMAGYPRNFVKSATDDPSAIGAGDVATAVRKQQTFTTIGPFVEMKVNGSGMGETARATSGEVELSVRVQAASWIDCDRVKVVVNGDVVEEIAVDAERKALRLETTRKLAMKEDGWVTVLVEGDDSLSPIVPDQGRACFPIAVVNPVWVDADGDGKVTGAFERGAKYVAGARDLGAFENGTWKDAAPVMRACWTLAAAELKSPLAMDLARWALSDGARKVRIAGLHAAATLGDAGLRSDVARVWGDTDADAYTRVMALRALVACGETETGRLVSELLQGVKAGALKPYAGELAPLLGDAGQVREFSVVGYFAKEQGQDLKAQLRTECGPEKAGDAESFDGRDGAKVTWKTMTVAKDGYLNLQLVDPDKSKFTDASAYVRCWVESPDAREVVYAVGHDDACRVWVNGEMVHEDTGEHAATMLQHVGKMKLKAGRNAVLIKVANGGGGFGMYFRVFDEEVR